ncbi:B-cell receptor CD22 [Nothobranchius furzeri]|uniref:B-cell receptor CD22 n=2 Tax=Nothobranchius furzeri TaxID=105023 RepID=A0A9D2YU13_NOTFU|nr:B-cell receptor CD22-like [Nothobranchius furzeri]
MIPHAVRCLVFLALMKNVSGAKTNPFVLENLNLTAEEGSCVEIKCKPNRGVEYSTAAYWFWMKDAKWSKDDFDATIVYSTDLQIKPISTQFSNRSTVSPPKNHNKPEEFCNILICDLNETDSGEYKFRYVNGDVKWVTDPPTQLTVKKNLCPIAFNKQVTVAENKQVTLTCSTSPFCTSRPEIYNSTQSLLTPGDKNSQTPNSITHSFNASWMNDGNVFSCQTTGNSDKYLIRNLTLTVKHAPKEVQITKSHKTVKENDVVTLNCSAKGQPKVSFSWFKNNRTINQSGAEVKFTSIKESDSGSYHCRATNTLGAINSTEMSVEVFYPPEVTVEVTKKPAREPLDHVLEGDKVTLTCTVKRSKPPPTRFTWFKNNRRVSEGQKKSYDLLSVKPENHGVYRCEARNSVGSRKSNDRSLDVQYKPRSHISIIGAFNDDVIIDSSVTFTCDTSANPSSGWYSWYRHRRSDSSKQKPLGTHQQTLIIKSIKRSDEACYLCNTSNAVGEGEMSKPKCIRVLFPPTNVTLSLPHKVTEGQTVNIRCSAESSPASTFQLQTSPSSKSLNPKLGDKENSVTFTLTATSADAVVFTCVASNSEGTNVSAESKLNVEYSPKDVRIEPRPRLEVKENEPFSLDCTGRSNPSIDSYTWIKNNEEVKINTKIYLVNATSPSDSGWYRCEARNTLGTGKSQPVEVKVKYAPKHATIMRGKEKSRSDGRLSVELECTSQSYPQAKYSWYNTTTNTKFSDKQTVMVYSHQPGELYCVAANDLGTKNSDPIRAFHSGIGRTATIFFICFVLVVIILIFLVYRHKNKYNPRGTNMAPCCGFLVFQKESRRRKGMNETIMTEPSRSREELLAEQLRCPHPDATPSTDTNMVYATVNLPQRQQAPSAPTPAGQKHENKNDDSLNYASLHFEKKKKPNKDPECSRVRNSKSSEDDVVYSKVCKPKDMEQEDYENVSPFKVKPKNDYDSDTSEEEVEVHYTQVNFKAKPGHQKTTNHSSSSEDGIQYSQVKL